MFTPAGLVGFLIVVAMLWLVFHLMSQTNGRSGLGQRDRAELDGLRSLVDDLKETAWEHRELDSALSTIIIDKIRTYERRNRELGP
jgi:hypothetical protein